MLWRVANGDFVQALNDICGKMDKLAVAWETLDKQNRLKVFDLAALENKVREVTAEVSVLWT